MVSDHLPVREPGLESAPHSFIRMQLNSFRLIEKENAKWPGKKLRFTITLRIDVPSANPEIMPGESLGFDIEGCLARKDKWGTLSWTPPQARSGNFYANIIWVTPDLYKRVKNAIEGSRFHEKLDPPIPYPLMVDPRIADPSLPETLEA